MESYQHCTDPELLALLRAGDEAAFETIYRRYAKDLLRYARKNVPVREDCEEMVHEVFTSLWERHNRLLIESLKHYLFNSIRYMVIRYFHNRGIRKRYVEHYTVFAELHDTGKLAEEELPLQEKLLKCLAGLPERCREAMTLRIVDNLSNTEIAQRMNISKGTVEVYMTRALTHLRGRGEEILG